MSKPSPQPGQQLVMEARNILRTIQEIGIYSHIHWVPGNVDVSGHETADKLVKKGAEGTRIAPDVLTSITHLKRKPKATSIISWKRQWHTSNHGRGCRGTPVTNIIALFRGTINRQTTSTISQIRTGHPHTNFHLSRVPTTDLPHSCKCKNQNQIPENLVLYCPDAILKAQRNILKQAIKAQPVNWRTAMHTNPGLAATIIHFLEPTKVEIQNWTPKATNAEKNQRQGLGLYNDVVGENDRE